MLFSCAMRGTAGSCRSSWPASEMAVDCLLPVAVLQSLPDSYLYGCCVLSSTLHTIHDVCERPLFRSESCDAPWWRVLSPTLYARELSSFTTHSIIDGMAGWDVTSVYRNIIDEVITKSRHEFVQEGVDE